MSKYELVASNPMRVTSRAPSDEAEEAEEPVAVDAGERTILAKSSGSNALRGMYAGSLSNTGRYAIFKNTDDDSPQRVPRESTVVVEGGAGAVETGEAGAEDAERLSVSKERTRRY